MASSGLLFCSSGILPPPASLNEPVKEFAEPDEFSVPVVVTVWESLPSPVVTPGAGDTDDRRSIARRGTDEAYHVAQCYNEIAICMILRDERLGVDEPARVPGFHPLPGFGWRSGWWL
jgi:hypothetical protein